MPGHPRCPPRDPVRSARAAPPGRSHLFGAFGEAIAEGLQLRHDHSSQFVADDFQRELVFLGIASSPAFVREPEGNGCVERSSWTLKENLLWGRRFDTVEELRLALHAFKDSHNRSSSAHGYARRRSAASFAALTAAGLDLQRGVSPLHDRALGLQDANEVAADARHHGTRKISEGPTRT